MYCETDKVGPPCSPHPGADGEGQDVVSGWADAKALSFLTVTHSKGLEVIFCATFLIRYIFIKYFYYGQKIFRPVTRVFVCLHIIIYYTYFKNKIKKFCTTKKKITHIL